MAVTRHDASSLEALGIDRVQSEVFFAVLTTPDSDVADLSVHSGHAESVVGSAAHQLMADGLIVRIAGEPARFRAVSPKAALRSRLAHAENAVSEAQSVVGDLERLFGRMGHSGHPAGRLEVIAGTDNVASAVRRLQDTAVREIRTFDTPPYVSDPISFVAPTEQAARAGVTVRGLYDRAAVAIPGRLEGDIAACLAGGEIARVVTALPLKMVLIDDQAALLPQTISGDIVDSAYLVHPCSLLDGLIALFEALWATGLPLAARTGGDVPDEETRRLLTLLMAGHTDLTIARAFGISPRTAQRRVQSLMRTLNAETRFQAGVTAAKRGWL
ncbi:helix-turn-helix domain-containing protein [Actinomadura sp. DC4]|uniref:helix-turn-helix domain-containing protein n=1 Tax=Actinomadura sp. DC4 TaxID=3055069 RepID=UPI0025B0BA68|nr:helix-turn-helix domain-containing protein [Actinomadura sp. DC4]MDN3357904.1 helix-turn-helix domain-containing protein [Actinomadura sp. DC4]